jgi:hypothetical protein
MLMQGLSLKVSVLTYLVTLCKMQLKVYPYQPAILRREHKIPKSSQATVTNDSLPKARGRLGLGPVEYKSEACKHSFPILWGSPELSRCHPLVFSPNLPSQLFHCGALNQQLFMDRPLQLVEACLPETNKTEASGLSLAPVPSLKGTLTLDSQNSFLGRAPKIV